MSRATQKSPPGQRVTLAAVARAAGVSVSTASLAYSGQGPVSDRTRDKVLAAAEALGYSGPDPRARSLRRGRSGVVGVVVEKAVISAFRDPVLVGMVDGIVEVLGDAGAGVLLLTDSPHARNALDEAAMDGVVLTGCNPSVGDLVDAMRHRRIPTVLVGSHGRPGVPAVDVDNPTAATTLARHLHDLGHRRVAGVTLPLDPHGTEVVTEELRRAAVPGTTTDRLDGQWAVFPGSRALAARDSSVDEGERLGLALLDAPPGARPTAVIAQSDLLAVGVIRAAQQRGLSVPADLSVVGFDGIEVQSYTAHRLTTMRQPMQDKGRQAAATVLRLIDGGRPRSVSLDCEFVLGDTTAPPR